MASDTFDWNQGIPVTSTNNPGTQGFDFNGGVPTGGFVFAPGVLDRPPKESIGQSLTNPLKAGIQNVKQIASGIGKSVKNIFTDNYQGSDFSKGFQTTGNIAKAALSPITETVGAAVHGIADTASNNPTVQKIANSKIGQVLTSAGGIPQNAYDKWAAQHPEASKNLEALGNIAALATSVPAGGEIIPKAGDILESGATKAKSVVGTIADKTIGESALARDLAKGNVKATDSTWKMIQPVLNKTEQAQAVAQGRIVSSGKLGKLTLVPQKNDLAMIEAAKPYVASAKNELDAVAKMRTGIANEATQLRAGLKDTGAIYTKSQVQGALSKIETPTLITADSTLNKAYGIVKNKMLQLVGDGGNLENLLDARQKFDTFVERQFPNLYDSDRLTPMRSAITDIRTAINKVVQSRLPEGKLPDGTPFDASLRKQTLLYNAIDNTAPKVGKIGTNAITRFVKNNPKTTKALIGGVGLGAGAFGVGKIVNKVGPFIAP